MWYYSNNYYAKKSNYLMLRINNDCSYSLQYINNRVAESEVDIFLFYFGNAFYHWLRGRLQQYFNISSR